MAADRVVFVAKRPTCPLVAFDGDCEFCRQWVRRWQGMTGDRVAYRPSREIVGDYPEIGEGGFRARVWLIEPDGRALGGAAAALRLYDLAGDRHWPYRIYAHVPGFAPVAEAAYDLVASHRMRRWPRPGCFGAPSIVGRPIDGPGLFSSGGWGSSTWRHSGRWPSRPMG